MAIDHPGMHGQPKFIGFSTEPAAAIGERQAEQRHAFFLPGSRSSGDVGFPMNQPSGFERRAIRSASLSESSADFMFQRIRWNRLDEFALYLNAGVRTSLLASSGATVASLLSLRRRSRPLTAINYFLETRKVPNAPIRFQSLA